LLHGIIYVEYIEWIVTYNFWNKTNNIMFMKDQVIMTFYADIYALDIPDIVGPVIPIPPVHSTSLGSGSHSPLPVHVDVLDPLRICPGRQVNVIACPSSAGSR
jgi:hypothetical protein